MKKITKTNMELNDVRLVRELVEETIKDYLREAFETLTGIVIALVFGIVFIAGLDALTFRWFL